MRIHRMSDKPNTNPYEIGECVGAEPLPPHMRTIEQAAEWLHRTDPECALTRTGLRRLVVAGVIPSVRNGTKYMLALENLAAFLYGTYTGMR